MFVFIDTTETHISPGLRGPSWEKLSVFLANKSHAGYIPRVVFLETVGFVERSLVSSRNKLKGAVRELSKFCTKPEIDHTLTFAAIDAAFLTDRIRAVRLRICEHADVSIDKLVGRAIKRQKPFDNEGKVGFRDAIIWESMLAVLAGQSSEAVLISNNSTDFGSGDSIPEQLTLDLETVGFSGRFTVVKTLSTFVETYVDPTLKKADEVAQQVANSTYPLFDVAKFFRSHEEDIRAAVRKYVDLVHGSIPTYFDGGQFRGISMARLLSASAPDVTARHLDSDEVSISSRFTAKLLVTATEWSPANHLPDWDPVALESDAELTLTIVVNEKAATIVDFAFDVRSLRLTRRADVPEGMPYWSSVLRLWPSGPI